MKITACAFWIRILKTSLIMEIFAEKGIKNIKNIYKSSLLFKYDRCMGNDLSEIGGIDLQVWRIGMSTSLYCDLLFIHFCALTSMRLLKLMSV